MSKESVKERTYDNMMPYIPMQYRIRISSNALFMLKYNIIVFNIVKFHEMKFRKKRIQSYQKVCVRMCIT